FLTVTLFCAIITFCGGCHLQKSTLSSTVLRFPADGVSGGTVRVMLARGATLKDLGGDTGSIAVVARERDGDTDVIYFRSTQKKGTVRFETSDGAVLRLTFYKNDGDIDGDGFPESAELSSEEDRTAFRQWFVRIAQSQFIRSNHSWSGKERDCSGLIRYAYREALKKHDERWLKRSGIVIDKNLPDVKKFNYPDLPILGTRIFKVSEGPASDISTFGEFADASTLARLNTFFVSRNIEDAKSGDLLFFRFEENREYPYHSMIVDRDESGSIFCIYHTGTADIIKRVGPSYLAGSHYEPTVTNERFLGVYRFHILE
ncbi:MAG TPA: DUF1175 family protein, partial [Spirochaetota bacterium]